MPGHPQMECKLTVVLNQTWLQWTASLRSSGLDKTAADLDSNVREVLAKPQSRPSTGDQEAESSGRRKRKHAHSHKNASARNIPPAARLAEQRAQERRAARAQMTAAWLSWQGSVLSPLQQAGHHASAAAGLAHGDQSDDAAEDEQKLVRQTVKLPGIRELLSAEDGLDLDASIPSDDQDSDVGSDIEGLDDL